MSDGSSSEYDDYHRRGYRRSSTREPRFFRAGAGSYGSDDFAVSYGGYRGGSPYASRGYDDFHSSHYFGYGGYDECRHYDRGYGGSRYEHESKGHYDSYSRDYGSERYGSSYDRRNERDFDQRRSGDRYSGGTYGYNDRGRDVRARHGDGGHGSRRSDSRGLGGRRDTDYRCGGSRNEGGRGAGLITGSGYENIGDAITDSRLRDEWSGLAGVRDVPVGDPDLLKEVQFCSRPPRNARSGKTIQLRINYFSVTIESGPPKIYKYHVTVEHSCGNEVVSRYGPSEGEEANNETAVPVADRRPGRPLQRALVTTVVNAVLRQYEDDFDGIRVVHDGMATLYSPDLLPWDGDTMEFKEINPHNTPHCSPPGQVHHRGPRTFDVKMELVETIRMPYLLEHYSDSDVNVMPVLQALDVVVRYLASQRAILVGRDLYSMKKTHTLRGGKELCWGYHQAVRKAAESLVLNVNETAAVFYSPGSLMQLVVAALRVSDARQIRHMSERQLKSLSYALRKVEVVPTHRTDRPRAIYGVSAEPADRLIVNIKGEEMTVAEYFVMKYQLKLRFPHLPSMNVGSKRPGKETWLPIETPQITRFTALPPETRKKNIIDHVKQAEFSSDPYLGAFGMKINLQMKITNARVLEPPCVQYQNTSERPVNGEWSLKDKKFVKGVVINNWGVVVLAEVGEHEVRKFLRALCDVGHQRGVLFENTRPAFVHQNDHRGVDVDKLLMTCFKNVLELGTPEMLLVVLPDTSSWLYGPVKMTSDTVLGVPCQCVASKNLRKANAAFCANVCLKLNMRLNGKNAVLRDPLPLLSTSPTIIIGADVEHPRPGIGSQASIAAVVASMDAFSSQYSARVAAQKVSSDISKLPHMLRELFLAYYEHTKRKPEHVLYYRDGVGEGQYFDVLQAEIRALRKSFKMISKDYNPPITFIVANKRHHTRAFPVDRHDADRRGNVKPGTVIDIDVVDPHRFDFFMFGHSSLQGTSKPCHYTVLYDENKLSAESIQRLTYDLGYTFSRSTHAVSVAAPVYYANEAAAHARHYLKEGSTTDSANRLDGSTFRFARVHKNLTDTMFFI